MRLNPTLWCSAMMFSRAAAALDRKARGKLAEPDDAIVLAAAQFVLRRMQAELAGLFESIEAKGGG